MHKKNTRTASSADITLPDSSLFGFSLIEMALIVMIVGAIVASIIPLLGPTLINDAARNNFKIVQQARTEITGKIMEDSTYTLPGTEIINGQPFIARSGTDSIPTRQDFMRKPLQYYPGAAGPTTNPGYSLTTDSICNINDTNLRIRQYDINNNPEELENIAFVIISQGKNQNADFQTTTEEISGHEYQYIIITPHGTANNNRQNDDIILWTTLDYLKGRFCN